MHVRLAVASAVLGAVLLGNQGSQAQPAPASLSPGARVYLHAHNCYPDNGKWADRIDRALAAGAPHLAIEQDLVWVAPANGRPGRSVVAHDTPAHGSEPSLDEHFFGRVRPLIEKALRENRRDAWPVLVLHLDFKTNEPEHHRYVWDLLGRHADWLTTARRTPDGAPPSPLEPGPLLVLTENGAGQEQAFHVAQPVGTRLRLFGTVPPDAPEQSGDAANASAPSAQLRPAAQPSAHLRPVDRLIPSGATSYRRWTNHSWAVVERGGSPAAGAWLDEERVRLSAIVDRAHALGLWVRFYTLNGHAGRGDGWSAGYNVGSEDAVRVRWRAAIDAGVEFIASDQYELLARELVSPRSRQAR